MNQQPQMQDAEDIVMAPSSLEKRNEEQNKGDMDKEGSVSSEPDFD